MLVGICEGTLCPRLDSLLNIEDRIDLTGSTAIEDAEGFLETEEWVADCSTVLKDDGCTGPIGPRLVGSVGTE